MSLLLTKEEQTENEGARVAIIISAIVRLWRLKLSHLEHRFSMYKTTFHCSRWWPKFKLVVFVTCNNEKDPF